MKKIRKIVIPLIIVILIIAGVLIKINHTRTHYTTNYDNGNTDGNLYNGGYFCEKDGTIFFANPNDQMRLYSMSRTGNDLKKVSSDTVSYINADDYYVYYTRNNADNKSSFSFLNIQNYSLCRIEHSGKRKTILDGDPCLYATQVGDYIYYIHYDKEEASTLYRIKIDGKEKTQISKRPIIAVATKNQYLYYAGVSEEHDLHCVDTVTNSDIRILDGIIYNPVIEDNYVYYMDGNNNYRLAKTNLDTGDTTLITTDRVDCFNIAGSYLYYQKNSKKHPALCRIKTDGSGFEEVYAGNYSNINVTSSYVYFTEFDSTGTFYYLPTSGKINVNVFQPSVIED